MTQAKPERYKSGLVSYNPKKGQIFGKKGQIEVASTALSVTVTVTTRYAKRYSPRSANGGRSSVLTTERSFGKALLALP